MTASLAVSIPADAEGIDSDALAIRLRRIANRLSLRLGADRFGQSAR